jgi:HPt (histidine-containing phosphotransfer) domain-containing protein
MVDMTQTGIDAVIAPPLVPADRPIDLVHLSRMTLGDRSLECEVLALFDRQVTMLMERIEAAEPAVAAAAAHTLKGSATGIGAFGVAQAAGQVEEAAVGGDGSVRARRVAALRAAMQDAQAEIRQLLQA